MFSKFLMGIVGEHTAWVYTIVAIVCFVVFMGMCLFAKEGEYPEPTRMPSDHVEGGCSGCDRSRQ